MSVIRLDVIMLSVAAATTLVGVDKLVTLTSLSTLSLLHFAENVLFQVSKHRYLIKKLFSQL